MRAAVVAVAALACAIGMTPLSPAAALDQTGPVSVVVVDFQGVARASKAAKAIGSQIDQRREVYQKRFGDLERKLREEEQALTQQRAILSQDAFQTKFKEFQDRVAQVQRQAQESNRVLQQAFQKSMEQVNEALIKVISDIAEETKTDIVLHKRAIVIGHKRLDISQEALKRLDERLPAVKVELPAQ